ncbi:Helicase associated domain protein [Streptomyces sp. WAC05950]|uniref:Helicase associated domain protein n=1 Tax=Streptomyces sp. WAC05950 TaxID=2487419 RepID=UPI00163BDD4A|nr:Helicase associated domain protein [Streptomyces sp. WAC05950]
MKPEIAKTLNIEKSGFTADQVSVGANVRAWWNCPDGLPGHEPWCTVVNNRTGGFRRVSGTGCPDCKLVQTSAQELRLKAELGTVLPIQVERDSVRTDRTEKVDIVVPPMSLILEFDGSYYHAAPDVAERDAEKARRLRATGWTTVRIREAPLTPLDTTFDVVVRFLANPEEAAADVLDHLAALGLVMQQDAQSYRAHGRPMASELAKQWIKAKLGEQALRAERRLQDEAWDRMYDALLQFEEQNGHSYPSDEEWTVERADLGRWARKQRWLQREGRLREDRVIRLANIESWSDRTAYEAEFWQGYERYLADTLAKQTAEAEHQDLMPQRVATIWASNLRSRRKARQQQGEDLPAEQLEAMAKVPGWSWAPFEAQFQAKVDALWQYWNETERPIETVKQREVWNGHPVGVWLNSFRTRRDRLDALQQHELQRLPGWSWSPQQEKWDRNLCALRRFAELNGHANPSRTSEDPGEKALATWKRNNKNKLQGRADANASALRELLKTYGENMG